MEQDAVKDFLAFKKMITPTFIQIIFWLGVAGAVIFGLISIFSGDFLPGLLTLILGPIMVRIYCEIMIVFFRMQQSLHEMNSKMKGGSKGNDNILDS